MSDKTYYGIKAISSSSLKWFEVSPKYFYQKYNDEIDEGSKPWLDLGKRIHMAMLEPDKFEQEYSFVNFDIPKSRNQKSFCEVYIKNINSKKEEDKALVDAYSKNYVIKGLSDERILDKAKKLAEELEAYIKYLKKSSKVDKTLINRKTKEIIESGLESLKMHKLAHSLLSDDEILLNPDVDAYNELEILWDYPRKYNNTVIHCKSMLDRIIVDHKNKTIKLVDIKTISNMPNRKNSIYDLKYYRQLTFYWLAIKSWFDQKYTDKNSDEYDALSYIIFVGTSEPYECRVIKVDKEVVLRSLKDVDEIVMQIGWHLDSGEWDYPYYYYETDGFETFTEHDLYTFKIKDNEI